ncbi:MAG TPA: aldehyde dehydrogenase family protein, partial [Miltoncostaeaceae bacterium]|nr:aldehyde dehydrogenase family protein [Miltoncostaeaceae bacterium]
PHDEAVISRVAAAGRADVDAAVATARAALPGWAGTPPLERAAAIGAFARAMDGAAAELADLMHREMGKHRTEARAEVDRACEVVHHFAAEAERLWVTQLPGADLTTGSHIRPAPIGVVAAITPWNFPVALVIWKLAPALAAGCCVIVKPAQEAPLAARRVCELAIEAGIPPGVVVCLTGDGPPLGEALATHPGIDKVAFTGSRRVAELIAGWAAPRLKALSLELGGHGPLVVLPDADLDTVAEVAAIQGYANAGQACYSINRVIVPRALAGAVTERLRARIADLALAPMATTRGAERHRMLIADARAHGGTVEGGEDVGGRRFAPALITGAGPGVRVVDEEPFTPIVSVIEVDDVDAAIAEANRPDYGLVGYICGRDYRRTLAAAQAIECGTVVINGWRVVVPYAPYAGWRGSGVGSELGRPGLEAFVRWQHLRVLA